MAKRYYWLKLKEDFFTQPRIKKLRKVAGGDTYTLIYLQMQLLSLENDGILLYESLEADFAEELALKLDEDVENVRFVLLYLQQYGLLEEVKENEFIMPETIQNIGTETNSTKRVQKHRETKKALQCNADCNVEKEKDIELEKDTEKEYMSSSSSYAEEADLSTMLVYNDTPVCSLDYQQVAQLTDRLMQQYWEKPAKDNDYNIVFEYTRQRTVLPNGEAVAVIDNDKCALLERAFLISQESGRTTWKYVHGILQRWEQLGLRTILDIEQHEHLRNQKKLEQAV